MILEARGLRVAVAGRDLFSGVDLMAGQGERVAVLGPSGSGKTSLLAVLAGLAAPAAGTVRVDGIAVGTGVPARTGVVLQGYGLVSLLTASENVEVGLRVAGVPAADAVPRAVAALAEVGLAERADHLVGDLSGGQRQRVAVARAVSVATRLLIADEPTAEQDPATRALVLDLLLAVADRGGAVVVATHDPEVAARCERTVRIA